MIDSPRSSWCCEACKSCTGQDLKSFMSLGTIPNNDQRAATVVVLALQRLAQKLQRPQLAPAVASAPHDGHHVATSVKFTRNDSMSNIFGPEDAAKSLCEESMYWSILTALAHTMQTHGADCWLEHYVVTPGTASLNSSPCSLSAVQITWSHNAQQSVAQHCGALLRTWFPGHASAWRPTWSQIHLERISDASKAGLAVTVIGAQERQLVSSLLLLPKVEHMPVAPSGNTPGLPHLYLQSLHGHDPTGASVRQELTEALLATLPYCLKLEWRSFGKCESQGQALLVMTNGCGIFLCIAVRAVSLVRSGTKAKGSTLSWPGRLGQAAKMAKSGPPGQKEEQAVQRRRQKRHGAARGALHYAQEIETQLPPGSIVFSAVFTSEIEGLQVASIQAADKPRQAVLLTALLGIGGTSSPLDWPLAVAQLPPQLRKRHGKRHGGAKGPSRESCTANDLTPLSSPDWLGSWGSWWGGCVEGPSFVQDRGLVLPALTIAGLMLAGATCAVLIRKGSSSNGSGRLGSALFL